MWIFISLSFFFVKVLLCYLLVTSTFSWGALFISEHNLLHQVTRAELRDSTHSPRYSTGSRWLGNSLAASFFLFVSVSEYFGTFVGSFFSVCLTVCGIFFPPLSPSGAIATLHAQTSRNVTGFCHRDCGGALSAVLTCTGRTLHAWVKLYTQKQNEGIACFPHSSPSSPLWFQCKSRLWVEIFTRCSVYFVSALSTSNPAK